LPVILNPVRAATLFSSGGPKWLQRQNPAALLFNFSTVDIR
jgi:hypothetical protein